MCMNILKSVSRKLVSFNTEKGPRNLTLTADLKPDNLPRVECQNLVEMRVLKPGLVQLIDNFSYNRMSIYTTICFKVNFNILAVTHANITNRPYVFR